jgi:hypothetical protein
MVTLNLLSIRFLFNTEGEFNPFPERQKNLLKSVPISPIITGRKGHSDSAIAPRRSLS